MATNMDIPDYEYDIEGDQEEVKENGNANRYDSISHPF